MTKVEIETHESTPSMFAVGGGSRNWTATVYRFDGDERMLVGRTSFCATEDGARRAARKLAKAQVSGEGR